MQQDLLSGYPTASSPGSRLDANFLMRMLSSHPGRQRFRWFRSYLNPEVAGLTKETPAEGKYVRIEQNAATPYTGIFDAHRTTKTYRDAFGALDESQTTLVYIPSTTPLSMGDNIIPWGKAGDGSDSSKMIYRQALVRGGQKSAGAGRISVTGTTLTATESHDLVVSDVVWVLGSPYLVTAVPTGTTATLATSPGTLTNVTWELGRDWLDVIYPHGVESVLMPTVADPTLYGEDTKPPIELRYKAGVLGIAGGERRYFVSWLHPTRIAIGSNYSINVTHTPVYRVSEGGISLPGFDYDSIYEQLRGRVVDSPQSLPQMAVLTLVVR